METILYLIRHGETEWNKSNKVQGKTDIELSENGRVQGRLLAERLKEEGIDFIYTSNLKRARETAEFIAKNTNSEIIEMDIYQEINLGPWEGKTIEEIRNMYSEDYRVYREDPINFKLEGAENLLQVAERVYKGIIEIIEKHKGLKIAIVSHGTAIKAAIMEILDIDINRYNRFRIDNASITKLVFRDDYFGGVVVNTLNETNHLNKSHSI